MTVRSAKEILESARKKSLANPKFQKFQKEKEKEKEAQLVLPIWADEVRGVPNGILRSALFGVVQKGRKAYLENVEVASIKTLKIIYTGPQLNQNDLDVWMQCIHNARKTDSNFVICFHINDFLRQLGKGNKKKKYGTTQHDWFKKTLKRLCASVVEIKDGPREYFGAMIARGAVDEDSKMFVVELNKDIARLFTKDSWTGLQASERKKLKSNQIAKWLHSFFSSHKNPYPYKIETIHQLCGSNAEKISEFKKDLKKALVRLEQATAWTCEIDEKNLVHIKKNGKGNAAVRISQ